MDDDCFDAAEEEMGREPRKDDAPPVTVTIAGLTQDDIIDAVLSRIAGDIDARMRRETQDRVRVAIEKAVDAAVTRVAEAELDAEVRSVIANGWEEHTQWGSKTGKKFTLGDRVLEYLRESVDTYGQRSHNGTVRYKRLMAEAVDAAFKGEIGKAIAEMQAEAKKILDEEFKARFQKSLKSALGLA